MAEEKRLASAILKCAEDLSEGRRVILKSPMIAQGQEISGIKSTKDCKKRGLEAESHGP